ncbi:hypothetical protein [Adhaeribacter rhizoryzae]|uniref:Uncharacterized protein n=1 Tax=Adhaeribacter rhizoryzae TaxID=2607907 RepID=A0A5M6D5M8_9BACT|nr:hypothetical protein [Adhaeribacter rhizoryzae]KAA5542056.1 hypothetical protein F0145_19915 [Adhaeribacter rhizoryzae]
MNFNFPEKVPEKSLKKACPERCKRLFSDNWYYVKQGLNSGFCYIFFPFVTLLLLELPKYSDVLFAVFETDDICKASVQY